MDKLIFDKEENEIYREKIIDDYNLIIHKNEIDIEQFDYDNSSINNVFNFININKFNIDKLNTICITFKIIRNYNIINYAYLYCNYDDLNNILEYKYITLSPSLESKYGEFRRGLINFNKFKLLSKYQDLIYYFEKNITKKFKNNKFKLIWEIFSEKKSDKINNFITNEMAINYYIIAYIIELYKIYNKQQEKHINKLFGDTMFDDSDLDYLKFYIKLNKENEISIQEFIIDFTKDYNNFEYSQKIVPFSFLELSSSANIIHTQWKELVINNRVNNLLYNFVTVGFPIYVDWFLIHNSSKNLYDNKSIFKKLLYNEQLLGLLKNYDKYNDKKKYNRIIIDNYINLKEKRNVSYKSNINNILFTNYSICYVYEYVGDTFYNNLKKDGSIITNYKLFSKYLFEIIYNLYCLNLKGIIHKDLHFNNITINNKFHNKKPKNVYDLYNINSNVNKEHYNYLNNIQLEGVNDLSDKNYIYKFNNNNNYINLIDFNQSILYHHSYNYSAKNNKNNYTEKLIDIEKINIVNILKNLFPEYIKNNKEEFLNRIKEKDNYYNLFVNLSAYDIFKLTEYFIIYFKTNEPDIQVKKLIDDLHNDSLLFLENIKNNITTNEFPNYIFLTTYFKEFNMKKKDNDIISNIFNIDNVKNDNNNIPSKQYNFYLGVDGNSSINEKLLNINSEFFKNRSLKISNTKKIFEIGQKNTIDDEVLLLKKILSDYDNESEYINKYNISDF